MSNAYGYQSSFDDSLAAEFKGILSQGFDPRQLQNLLLWLDASDSSTIVKDGSNLISKWLDKSDRKNHAIQDNAAKKATYSSDGFNGRPTVIFDNKHFLAPENTIGDLTIFSVFTNDNTFPIGGTDVDVIISHEFNVTTANGFINTSEPQFRQEHLISASYNINGAVQAGNNTPLNTGIPYLGSIAANRTESTYVLGIGGHRSGTGFGDCKGNISEIILFSRRLTDTQRQLVEAYLSAKWAITLQ
ncbi:MAG: hypothetical protein O2832_02155 [Proteobacteria bacterium]|nr:hypothetical protein [Pseudomonadota bacterium]